MLAVSSQQRKPFCDRTCRDPPISDMTHGVPEWVAGGFRGCQEPCVCLDNLAVLVDRRHRVKLGGDSFNTLLAPPCKVGARENLRPRLKGDQRTVASKGHPPRRDGVPLLLNDFRGSDVESAEHVCIQQGSLDIRHSEANRFQVRVSLVLGESRNRS